MPRYNIGPLVELIRIDTSSIAGSISSPAIASASAEAYQRSLSGIFLKLLCNFPGDAAARISEVDCRPQVTFTFTGTFETKF